MNIYYKVYSCIKYIAICSLILSINSCSQTLNKGFRKYNYTYKQLKEAWADKRSDYLLYAIQELKDTSLSHCEFSTRIDDLQNVCNFAFCWIDCADDSWVKSTEVRKQEYRIIIWTALDEYSKSCMFMQEKEWILCSSIDLHEYCNSSLLNKKDRDLRSLLSEKIKAICKECL